MAPDSLTHTYGNGRKAVARWLYVAIILYAVSFIIVAVFGVYVVIKGQQVNQQLCEVTNNNRNTLVDILRAVRRQALERATSVEERNIIRERYNELFAVIPPLACNAKGVRELEP